MKQQQIIDFFNQAAPHWDAAQHPNTVIIGKILDNAGVVSGTDVLDVACGTGVLFPEYLRRQVNSLTAVDLSPEMVRIAAEKYPPQQVTVCCGDVNEMEFSRKFDCIVIYNAFPHFPDPEHLISHLSMMLKPGGTLTVAHGAGKAQIDAHHRNHAVAISRELMEADELAALFGKYLTVTVTISTDEMYQVAGRK